MTASVAEIEAAAPCAGLNCDTQYAYFDYVIDNYTESNNSYTYPTYPTYADYTYPTYPTYPNYTYPAYPNYSDPSYNDSYPYYNTS
ncbi:MAG: hypothetical protein ACK559_08005, partial [bacterium]